MLKKALLCILVILGLLVCDGLVVGAKSMEQGAKSKTEAKISTNPSKFVESVSEKSKIQNPKSKIKTTQIGTPTVQQLLNKVKANYSKLKDLKADYQIKVRIPENVGDIDLLKQMLGLIGNLIIQKEKFYFKAPDKLKWIPPKKLLTVIIKKNVEYRRMGTGWGERLTKDTPVGSYKLPWYTLLDPARFDFYFRLDDIIEKFDTRVISRPATDTWVIEAVPKASNPEDDYNYPSPQGAVIRLFVDFDKGIIKKFESWCNVMKCITVQRELKDFVLLNNIWIPTTFIKIQPPFPEPYKKYRPEEIKEEITLSNIKINTGISNSEFEF